jgi:glucosyl-3-phosphoglycerate synthase
LSSPRSLHHSDLTLTEKRGTVSVCLPAREEAATIGSIVESLAALRERGAIDQLAVVDAGSKDGTAAIAAGAGAEVYDQAELMPEFGPVLGKGDAMWRSLSVLRGDVVCFLDADSEDFGPHFATGLTGALHADPRLQFVKACYRRPFRAGGESFEEGGGRVTELTARPLLSRFYPDLAAIRQPLAGEMAARRDLLERLPFTTGYGVEIAMLIDAYRAVGVAGLGQVDLDVRQNKHQPLSALGPMASAVLAAVATRLEREGRLRDGGGGERPTELVERPPMASLRAAA